MELDLRKVAAYVRRAETEELLDRVTVYRDGMEPAALDLMANELARRGLSPEDIAAHDRTRRETAILLRRRDGGAVQLLRAARRTRAWGWHRLWGRVPVFPRRFLYCEVHQP